MMIKVCPHCNRPLLVKVVCGYCFQDIDPIKTEVLIAFGVGILILGIMIGIAL